MTYILLVLILILFYFLKDIKNNDDNFDSLDNTIDNEIDNEIDNSILNEIKSDEERDLNCHLFGCNSSRIETNNMHFIGYDDKENIILSFNNIYYTVSDDIIVKTDTKKENIINNEENVMIPIKNNKLDIKLKLDDYELVGYLKNNYYKYSFLLYYKKIMDSLYEYIVVELLNDTYTVKYIMTPRQKIYDKENVYIEENRTLRLGPFIFTNKI
jgi:hypothetical protein